MLFLFFVVSYIISLVIALQYVFNGHLTAGEIITLVISTFVVGITAHQLF